MIKLKNFLKQLVPLKDTGYNKVAKKVLEMDNFLAKDINKEGSPEPIKVTNLQATNPTDSSLNLLL